MPIPIKGGGNFTPCPEGNFAAVLVDIVDLGMVTSEKYQKTQHKVSFTFQMEELDEKGLPFLVFKRYTVSLHEKASLTRDLKQWFKADAPKVTEKVSKDSEYLLGKGCRLEIVHDESGKYANVAFIKPLAADQKALKIHPDFVRKKDRADGTGPFGSARSGQASDPEDITDDDVPF